MDYSILLLYSTFAEKENAKLIGQKLMELKVIACYNLYSMESGYVWKGDYCEENEWTLICKSLPSLEIDTRKHLEELHPYDTPCILSWTVHSNPKYHQWIKDSVGEK